MQGMTRMNVSSVANGAVRKSFIDEGTEFIDGNDQQAEVMKEQTEVMLQSDENCDPPPEPV